MLNIPLPLRLSLIVGAVLFLVVLCILLRRRRLNVQYSIIWLAAGVVMLTFAVFPVLVAKLGSIFNVEMPVNLVFTLLFVFVLLLLLSLSTIATGFAERIKRLTQRQALLEERVRRLEEKQATPALKDSESSEP